MRWIVLNDDRARGMSDRDMVLAAAVAMIAGYAMGVATSIYIRWTLESVLGG